MNISYQDARDATMIAGASNILGVANTMRQMVENAIELNPDVIGNDDAVHWVKGHLAAIITLGTDTAGLYPVSLRSEVFVHITAVYRMVYRIDWRNQVMAYPPLTIAAQVLANIAASDSYRVGENRNGLVTHDILGLVDHGIPSPFSGQIAGEHIYVNWYSDAMQACEDRMEAGDD